MSQWGDNGSVVIIALGKLLHSKEGRERVSRMRRDSAGEQLRIDKMPSVVWGFLALPFMMPDHQLNCSSKLFLFLDF